MSAPLVVSYGGGANSFALLIGLHQRGVRPDAVVFADTMGEKPATMAHLRDVLPAWLASVDFPALTVVYRAGNARTKVGDASLEAECLRLEVMPSRAYGRGTCADKWKLDPFFWWSKEWPPALDAWARGDVVMRAIGYDADERHRADHEGDAGYGKVYPLIEWGWDRDECKRVIARAGLHVPPKSACFYCPSSTKTEVIALSKEHPSLFHRAVEMERRALDAGKSRIKGLGRKWSWAELVAADESQQDLFPEAPVESCTACMVGL